VKTKPARKLTRTERQLRVVARLRELALHRQAGETAGQLAHAADVSIEDVHEALCEAWKIGLIEPERWHYVFPERKS